MKSNGKFGDFLKARRIALRQTLRAFCEKNGFDPGNYSRLERGKMPPPISRERLEKHAQSLELVEGSDDWQQLFDLAFTEREMIPQEIADDATLMSKLPLLFRTLQGKQPTAEQLDQVIEIIKKV